MGQVEEQVEAFDQRGGYRHGRHAVHRFLMAGEEGRGGGRIVLRFTHKNLFAVS